MPCTFFMRSHSLCFPHKRSSCCWPLGLTFLTACCWPLGLASLPACCWLLGLASLTAGPIVLPPSPACPLACLIPRPHAPHSSRRLAPGRSGSLARARTGASSTCRPRAAARSAGGGSRSSQPTCRSTRCSWASPGRCWLCTKCRPPGTRCGTPLRQQQQPRVGGGQGQRSRGAGNSALYQAAAPSLPSPLTILAPLPSLQAS